MKLISLSVNPSGNPLDEIAEVVIDHDPAIFKSRYVALVKHVDGSLHLTSQPLAITEPQLQEAYDYAKQLLESVLDVIGPLP